MDPRAGARSGDHGALSPNFRHTLVVCCLLLLRASTAQLQAPPPSPPPAEDATCNVDVQRNVLILFYRMMGGPFWTNNTGWAAAANNTTPAAATFCHWKVATHSELPYLLPVMANSPDPTLPAHCCWFGVQCCVVAECPPGFEGSSYCGCLVGRVAALSLPTNNLTGRLDFAASTSLESGLIQPEGFVHELWDEAVAAAGARMFDTEGLPRREMFSAIGMLTMVSCSLKAVVFVNNHISGPLPPLVASIQGLTWLSLGFNQLTGGLPDNISELKGLTLLEVSNNLLNGSIPATLCSDPLNQLADLILDNNHLSGNLSIRGCARLIKVSITDNELFGEIFTNDLGEAWPSLHYVALGNNSLSGSFPLRYFQAPTLTWLELSDNLITGSLPAFSNNMVYLSSLMMSNNRLTGTLGSSLFTALATLTLLDLAGNRLAGTLPPEIVSASNLHALTLASNPLVGTIPAELVEVMGQPSVIVDLRGTLMLCCRANMSLVPDLSAYPEYESPDSVYDITSGLDAAPPSIEQALPRQVALDATSIYDLSNAGSDGAYINFSAPRLPAGLAFSQQLRPVAYIDHLACPFLIAAGADDWPYNYLSWFIDPRYYLYDNCACTTGKLVITFDRGWPDAWCEPGLGMAWYEAYYWIWIIVSLLAAFLLTAAAVWCLFKRGSRPVFVQGMIDARKRLKGPARHGVVSIVVTDIEGFSTMMKFDPEATTQALLLHNNLVRKAKWDNFGATIEQEGDSYSMAFHNAIDAVKFCLQAQLLLEEQSWPPALMAHCEPAGDLVHTWPYIKGSLRHGSAAKWPVVSKLLRATMRMRASRRTSTEDLPEEDSSDGPISDAPGSAVGSGQACPPQVLQEAQQEQQGRPFERPSQLESEAYDGPPTAIPAAATARSPADPGPHAAPHAAPLGSAGAWGATLMNGGARSMNRGASVLNAAHPERHLSGFHQFAARLESGARWLSARHPSTDNARSRHSAEAVGNGSLASAGRGGAGEQLGGVGSVDHRQGIGAAQGRKALPHPIMDLGPVCGLRVRMGVATGLVHDHLLPVSSAVMERAKFVSDCAAGGQVLMDAETFDAVQHSCQELACITSAGTQYGKRRLWTWGSLLRPSGWVSKRREPDEAVLLDMGEYAAPPPGGGSTEPLVMGCAAAACGGCGDGSSGGVFAAVSPTGMSRVFRAFARGGASGGGPARPQLGADSAGSLGAAPSMHLGLSPLPGGGGIGEPLHMFQVLAPPLVTRGRHFGSTVHTPNGWLCLDSPYYNAPSAMYYALHPADVVPQHLATHKPPAVAIAFARVDTASATRRLTRKEMSGLTAVIGAAARSILRQVPGAYLMRTQQSDMRFIATFLSPADALTWCIALQEALIYLDWPPQVLRTWPEVRATPGEAGAAGRGSGNDNGGTGELLFRGPRLKMGVQEGVPRSVAPDYTGRADYLGDCVNMAARFMDAAAHGGQIAVPEALARSAADAWAQGATGTGATGTGDGMGAAVGAAPASLRGETPASGGGVARAPPLPLPLPRASMIPEDHACYSGGGGGGEGDVGGKSGGGGSGGAHSGSGGVGRSGSGGAGGGGAADGATDACPLSLGSVTISISPEAPGEAAPSTARTVPAAAPAPPQPHNVRGEAGGSAPELTGPPHHHHGARPPTPRMCAADVTPPGCADVVALQLGLFEFKGSPAPVRMVCMSPARLAGNRYPQDPPKGKGWRVEAPPLSAAGVPLLSMLAPRLAIVDKYQRAFTWAASNGHVSDPHRSTSTDAWTQPGGASATKGGRRAHYSFS
ncbi:hypothetical protein FOA52_009713 [Chlamydomonas sp. UWO 241]|nr:hypothetical protein FOA52_009713 [Chlamydomonas sp. UWO 241]